MLASTYGTIGRTFFGICVAGIGLVHFILPGIQPIIAPLPRERVWEPLGYLLGVALTCLGTAIVMNKATRTVSLCLGILLLLFFLVGHVPQRIMHHPYILGYWTDAIKLIALGGGAFVLTCVAQKEELVTVMEKLAKVAYIGRYLYALMLILFGIDHFLYQDLVKTLVPGWIPQPLLWTYITGVALMGSGVSIVINFKVEYIAVLLAIMLFLWLVILHLPAAVRYPFADGILFISSLQCLAFCGIALLLAARERENKSVNKSRLRDDSINVNGN